MIIAENTFIRVSKRELPPIKVEACRIVNSTPESDGNTYKVLYYRVSISDFAN
jgi:hypothetical protein